MRPAPVFAADSTGPIPATGATQGDARSPESAGGVDADVALSDGDIVEGPQGSSPAVSPALGGDRPSIVAPGAKSASDEGAGSGLSWARAPIAWRGALTATYDMSNGGGVSTRSFGKSASFSGDSYIYAPWLARVNGGFNLSQTSNLSEPRSEHSGYAFDLGVNLFPVSRFPFTATMNRSVAGDFAVSRYALAQSYLPVSENFSTSAQYERSVFESPGLTNVIHRLTGNYRQNMRTEYPQTLMGSWNVGLSRPTTGANRSDSYDFRVEHTANLYDDYGLNVSNNASFIRAFTYGDPASGGGRIGARFAYLSSANSWEPFIDLPLVIHSSLSHSSTALTADSTTTFLDITTGELRTGYSFGNYLSLIASGRFDYIRSPEGARMTRSFSLVAQSGYGVGNITQFDVLGFKYSLGYSANAGLIAQSDSGDLAPTVGGSVTQSLARDFDVGLGLVAPLSFLLSQAYGLSWTSGSSSPKSVTTTLTLNWQYSQARYGFSSRFEAQDGRTIDATNPTQFQSIRWENQGRLLLSPVSSLNTSLTMGWSRQGSRNALDGSQELKFQPWVGSGTGTANYQNVRFMDVPRLTYTAAYAINFRPGLLASDNREGGHQQTFSQRLAYTIGRLRLGADHFVTMFGGQVGQSLNLTVTRELSGVL